MRLRLDVPLKGERDYLQGPDLILSTVAAAGEAFAAPVEPDRQFSFYRKTGRVPEVVFFDGATPRRSSDTFGTVALGIGGNQYQGLLNETAEPVGRRVPFDEEPIVAMLRFDGDRARLAGVPDGGYDFPEVVVAATKALHQRLHPVAADRHWVVSQWRQSRTAPVRSAWPGMTISLERRVGTHMTRSRVVDATGEPILHVFFSAALR